MQHAAYRLRLRLLCSVERFRTRCRNRLPRASFRPQVSALQPTNLLLESLSPEDRGSVLAHCEHVKLPFRSELFNTLQRPRYVHFLTSGVASMVTLMAEGEAVEVGLTGREGLAEKYQLLGPQTGTSLCFMQISGTAYRMEFNRFQSQFVSSTPLLRAVHRYIQHDAMVLGQLGACNRVHGLQERLARWLLMVHDRTGGSELMLTQQLLGEMLGAMRTSVAYAASNLQRTGCISYSRGHITINDRAALEQAACECYPTILKLLRNIYT